MYMDICIWIICDIGDDAGGLLLIQQT